MRTSNGGSAKVAGSFQRQGDSESRKWPKGEKSTPNDEVVRLATASVLAQLAARSADPEAAKDLRRRARELRRGSFSCKPAGGNVRLTDTK